jgi:hypothetical protein
VSIQAGDNGKLEPLRVRRSSSAKACGDCDYTRLYQKISTLASPAIKPDFSENHLVVVHPDEPKEPHKQIRFYKRSVFANGM